MRRLLTVWCFMVVCISSWASNPGEPLDCSDWVFLEPGLYCLEYPPSTPNPPFSSSDVDNQGRPLVVTNVGSFPFTCGGSPFTESNFEIHAWADGELDVACGLGGHQLRASAGCSAVPQATAKINTSEISMRREVLTWLTLRLAILMPPIFKGGKLFGHSCLAILNTVVAYIGF